MAGCACATPTAPPASCAPPRSGGSRRRVAARGGTAIAVLGAGAWGTALAAVLAPRHEVALWARDPAQAQAIRAARRNQKYLPEVELPANLTITSGEIPKADLVLIATPVSGMRE